MKLIIRTRREISFIQLLLSLRVRSVFFGGGGWGEVLGLGGYI